MKGLDSTAGITTIVVHYNQKGFMELADAACVDGRAFVRCQNGGSDTPPSRPVNVLSFRTLSQVEQLCGFEDFGGMAAYGASWLVGTHCVAAYYRVVLQHVFNPELDMGTLTVTGTYAVVENGRVQLAPVDQAQAGSERNTLRRALMRQLPGLLRHVGVPAAQVC